MPTRIENLKKAMKVAKGASANHFEQLQGQIDALVKFAEATEKRR